MGHFKLPKTLVADREKFILEQAMGKKVLHLGCANYPASEISIQENRWLHSKLSDAASFCTGIDLDGNSIKILRNKYGIKNIREGNAENLRFLNPKKYDLIVAGELIEHINNPGLFLQSVRSVISDKGKLLITTTNAYCFRRMLRIPFGSESVHPDHTYYFSHTTLETLVTRFGYKLEMAASYRVNNIKPFFPYITERLATMISPNFGEGIIHIYVPF